MPVYLIPTAVALILSAGIFAAAWFVLSKKHDVHKSSNQDVVFKEIQVLEDKLRASAIDPEQYISKTAYKGLQLNKEGVQSELQRLLGEADRLEDRLRSQQLIVEQLELSQQQVKSARAEDENALRAIMEEFSAIESEAGELESQLAQSQAEIEHLLREVELTKAQRSAIEDLQASLKTASEMLRQLLDEYHDAQDRLTQVTRQQNDLETEYSRLVEKLLS
jgi:chromosome segregation ATPase